MWRSIDRDAPIPLVAHLMSVLWLLLAFAAGLIVARFGRWQDVTEQLTRTWQGSHGAPAVQKGAVELAEVAAKIEPPAMASADAVLTSGALSQEVAAAATRAVQLRRLCDSMWELTDKTSHSREIANEPAFLEMVAILTDREMPLEQVLDYAFGTSWPHSCAALAALTARSDGDTAADAVIKYFGNYGIWQMAFALDYLASRKGAVPVGAMLQHHVSWWTDQAMVGREFEIYFTKLEQLKIGRAHV